MNKKKIEIKKRFKNFFENMKVKDNIKGYFYNKEKELNSENDGLIKYISGNYKQFYKNSSIWGEGTFGLVKKTLCLNTQKEFAVKIVRSRDEEIIFQLKEEFNYIRNLKHNNIIKLKELLIDNFKGKVYLIMEYFDSEELFNYISIHKNYDENIVRNLFKQLLVGIKYLHSHGVIHRDIKPNNILLSKDGTILKITDFNIAKFSNKYNNYDILKKDNYKMLTYTGTWAFNAPEKFEKNFYTEVVDCWSAGCILYTMLIGKQPFYNEHISDLINQIKTNNYDKLCKEWRQLNPKAKDLIEGLLKINPQERLSPKEALKHNWFKCDSINNLSNCANKIYSNRKSLVKNNLTDLNMLRSISYTNFTNEDNINYDIDSELSFKNSLSNIIN